VLCFWATILSRRRPQACTTGALFGPRWLRIPTGCVGTRYQSRVEPREGDRFNRDQGLIVR
jgi:hypothetical protein